MLFLKFLDFCAKWAFEP